VVVEGGDQRLQLDHQLLAAGSREGANHADGHQLAGVGVQAEQQRADTLGVGRMDAVAATDASRRCVRV